MSNCDGSYRYDTLESQVRVGELNRLYQQASHMLKIERDFWPSLQIDSDQRVLDLGCGSGVVTRELARYVHPASVKGLDLSQELIDRGEKAFLALNSDASELGRDSNISFQQGDAYSLPFSDKHFDLVYARLLFQHLSAPEKALAEILRVLKPGGRVCILDIDNDWSSMHPQPEAAMALRRAVINQQRLQGGDPTVGRKLGHYLKASGFSSVKTDIRLVDSEQIGLKRFVEMLSFGSPYQSADNELEALREKAVSEVKEMLDNPYAWAGFALFIVMAQKP